MPSTPLSCRAREIEAWVEAHMVDPNGIVYTFVDRTTGKLLTNEVVESVDPIRLKQGTTAGWWAYENTCTATAAYMKGLLFRYEQEGNVSALFRARRCFHAFHYIYEQGKQFEEGFMPKLYDGRYSDETSSDQVLFAMGALDHFHRHASPAEQKEIARMIAHMTHFFMKRDYKYTYFGLNDMQWPLARFTYNLLMAYRHSGDESFRREYDRLLAMGVNEHPGEEQLRPKLTGQRPPTQMEQEEGGWLLYGPINTTQMDLMELDYLLESDPTNPHAGRWRRSCMQSWQEALPGISEDGWAYNIVVVDFETGEYRLVSRARFQTPDENLSSDSTTAEPGVDAWRFFPFMTYFHSARCSYSTLLARAGTQISRHFPREITIRPMVRRIVRAFHLQNLTYFANPDDFDPRFKYMTNLISADSVGNWLWAYWQGRTLGIFDARD